MVVSTIIAAVRPGWGVVPRGPFACWSSCNWPLDVQYLAQRADLDATGSSLLLADLMWIAVVLPRRNDPVPTC